MSALNVGLGYTDIIPDNFFLFSPRAYLSFKAVSSAINSSSQSESVKNSDPLR